MDVMSGVRERAVGAVYAAGEGAFVLRVGGEQTQTAVLGELQSVLRGHPPSSADQQTPGAVPGDGVHAAHRWERGLQIQWPYIGNIGKYVRLIRSA